MELSIIIRCLFIAVFLVLFWSNCLASVEGTGVEEAQKNDLGIPFCSPEIAQQQVNRLVFVSTMDGKVSALSLEENGAEKWSIETGPGPMLSSSIHNLELSNNGQWVRMIPSLSGGLYKMNGKSVEAVPITAENLLKSSFRYSDEVVISGGIETRTYGVDSSSGKILYECSMASCDNYTTPEQRQSSSGDVVLIQRQTQTVRAIEPRDGTERWNFSVGQHDLKLSADPKASCHDKSPSSADEVVLKVIVPDGLVCALDSTGTVLWKHKFEFPVVSAWRVGRTGDIKYVDLFGGTRTPEEKVYLPESPVLYIGMHNKQLYIQESVRLRNKVLESVDRLRHHLITDDHLPSIPWRPIPAQTHFEALGIEGSSEPILRITDETSSTELQKTTAQSVLYASDYVDGKGFYLYATAEQQQLITGGTNCDADDGTSKGASESSESAHVAHNISEYSGDDDGTFIEEDEAVRESEGKDETPVQVIIVSFWYWWKEVMLTSIFTAIVVNLIIQRRFISVLYSGRMNEGIVGSVPEESTKITNVTSTTATSGSSAANLCTPASADFTSRYITDFEPIRRLGRGGFGIVFQAKNKMDDCEYAIKRIPLPNKEEALERMKREVKALAKLDNQNIVRYFNSWVEEPPPGWQETADNLYFRGREDIGSEVNIDLSGAITPTSDPPSPLLVSTASVRKRNVLKSLWDKASSAIYRTDSVDKDLVLPRTNDDASGSFIVFEHSKSNANSKTAGSTSRSHRQSKSEVSGSECEEVDEDHDTDVTDVSRSTRGRRHRRPVTLDLGSSDNSIPAPRQRKFLYIQMQLCQRDSLKDWLVCNPVREKSKVLNIFEQIVSAVHYVHCQGLIHRDLKPSNIFFSYDGQIKVGDFGLVTTMSEDEGVPEQRSPLFQNGMLGNIGHTAHVGTHLYMSPEQLAGRQYDYKVDIFSLGVILFELLTAFSTEMERAKTLAAVRRLEFPQDFEKDHSEEAALLRLMLCDDPNSRLTTIGVRERPPLRRLSSADSDDSADWHFTLPHRTRLRPSSSE